MVDIARCESGFRQLNEDGTVLHGIVDPRDTGLFQISRKYHQEEATEMGLDLDTVQGNISYALYLYRTQGVKPWSASEECWD